MYATYFSSGDNPRLWQFSIPLFHWLSGLDPFLVIRNSVLSSSTLSSRTVPSLVWSRRGSYVPAFSQLLTVSSSIGSMAGGGCTRPILEPPCHWAGTRLTEVRATRTHLPSILTASASPLGDQTGCSSTA